MIPELINESNIQDIIRKLFASQKDELIDGVMRRVNLSLDFTKAKPFEAIIKKMIDTCIDDEVNKPLLDNIKKVAQEAINKIIYHHELAFIDLLVGTRVSKRYLETERNLDERIDERLEFLKEEIRGELEPEIDYADE